MANYWLDLNEMPCDVAAMLEAATSIDELTSLYLSTKDKRVFNKLCDLLTLMATKLVDWVKIKHIEREDAIQECLIVALEKIERFDSSRGKAFNFFTTIMLNNLRSVYRKNKRYVDFFEAA